MAEYSPYETGGITGGEEAKRAREALLAQLAGANDQGQSGGVVATPEPPIDPSSIQTEKPDYTKLGQYKLTGYDMNKFNNPYDQLSEKYRIGLIQSHFDPRQGVTPEFLKALNDAGIHGAQFSGQGDQLNVNNAGGYERFGQGGAADVVKGLKGNNEDTAWQPWFVDEQGQPQPMPQGGLQGGAPSLMDTLNQGVPTDSDFFQKLLAQLRGIAGPASTDRNALLSLLGGG